MQFKENIFKFGVERKMDRNVGQILHFQISTENWPYLRNGERYGQGY